MKFVKNVLKTASLHIGIAFWLISCSDFVTPNRTQLLIVQSETSNAWASKIYPGDMFAQKVLISLVRIMKNHETNDPFNGGRSPGFDGFGLNRHPMGFYVDSTDTETDLLIFNWKDEVPAEFKDERALIDILGIPVYRVSKLPLKALATQSSVAGGANSFFSYLLGADQNFEPSADYLPKNHFLRKSLGNRMMPLCAPMSEWIDGQTLPYEKDPFLIVMDVMIHESYHLVESNWRRANDKQYSPNENADEMLAAIETPEFQQSLLVYYKSVVELMSMIDLPLPLNSFSKRVPPQIARNTTNKAFRAV